MIDPEVCLLIFDDFSSKLFQSLCVRILVPLKQMVKYYRLLFEMIFSGSKRNKLIG